MIKNDEYILDYITEEERAKCQKVADAFAGLHDMADIVVIDVGT